MKKLQKLVMAMIVLALLFVSFLSAQEKILWVEKFSDGNYTDNWPWIVDEGIGEVVNGEFKLSVSGSDFKGAWTHGDSTQPLEGDRYAIYYTTRVEGDSVGSAMYFKCDIVDTSAIYWAVILYPAKKGIYLTKYDQYVYWVKGLNQIKSGEDLKVCIQSLGDTVRVKVWPANEVEPDTYVLEYNSLYTTVNFWGGVNLMIMSWDCSSKKKHVIFDDIKFINYSPVSSREKIPD